MDYRAALEAETGQAGYRNLCCHRIEQLIESIISGIAHIRDREYLKSNFAFYSEDHADKTWEILEGHLKSNQETLSDASSDIDNSDTADQSEVDTNSADESSTPDSPVFQRRKHKINGIIFSDDASSSEGHSD